jgi:hypothetical protein
MAQHENSDKHYETRDAQIRPILVFGGILIVVTVFVLFVMKWMFDTFNAQEAKLDPPPPPLADFQRQPSTPRLQVNSAQELSEMRTAEDNVLNSYDWIDKEKGIVRIPIERAIELLSQKGLPTRTETEVNEEMEK